MTDNLLRRSNCQASAAPSPWETADPVLRSKLDGNVKLAYVDLWRRVGGRRGLIHGFTHTEFAARFNRDASRSRVWIRKLEEAGLVSIYDQIGGTFTLEVHDPETIGESPRVVRGSPQRELFPPQQPEGPAADAHVHAHVHAQPDPAADRAQLESRNGDQPIVLSIGRAHSRAHPPLEEEEDSKLRTSSSLPADAHADAHVTKWPDANDALASCGVWDSQPTCEEAARHGVTPADVVAIVEYYREQVPRYGPGALRNRVRSATPGEPPNARWPPPSPVADRREREAAAAAERRALEQEQAKRRAYFERRWRHRYDRMSREEKLTLLRSRFPNLPHPKITFEEVAKVLEEAESCN